MALPSSGPLSFQDVAVELARQPANTSLNDADVRGLARLPTLGSMVAMTDLHGKSTGPTSVIQTIANPVGYVFGGSVRLAPDSLIATSAMAVHLYKRLDGAWEYSKLLEFPSGYTYQPGHPRIATNRDGTCLAVAGKATSTNTNCTLLFELDAPGSYSFVQALSLVGGAMTFSPDGVHFFAQDLTDNSKFKVFVRNYATWALAHTSYSFSQQPGSIKTAVATASRLYVGDVYPNLSFDASKILYISGGQGSWSSVQNLAINKVGRLGYYMSGGEGPVLLAIALGSDLSVFPGNTSSARPYYEIYGTNNTRLVSRSIPGSPANSSWVPIIGPGAITYHDFKITAVVPTQRRENLVGSPIENVFYLDNGTSYSIIPIPNNASVTDTAISPDGTNVACASSNGLFILG